jgi:Fe-S cluster biogenesis protein NfuA/nitrite reductase/ring-hydroxylating ferredoxin subunit
MDDSGFATAKHDDLASFSRELERFDAIFETWDDGPRSVVADYRRTIDALEGEALRRLIRVLKTDPAALAAIKAAVGDEIVYAVLRYHDILKPSLNERIEAALATVRPMLGSHGGDVELVTVKPPRVELRFTGACDGCPASALTFQAGVKQAVQAACPEITEIVALKGLGGGGGGNIDLVSPFAPEPGGLWREAGTVQEIPDGGVRALEFGGAKLLLSRQGAVVTCFRNACAHLGSEIHEGPIERGIITCPWHGFRYDLTSGECLTAPVVRLQSHEVRVIGLAVEVRLAE